MTSSEKATGFLIPLAKEVIMRAYSESYLEQIVETQGQLFDFLEKAYYGLHDLDLELAVEKVGEQLKL